MREFRLLGPVVISHDGRPIVIEGEKPRVLLAVLLLEAGQVLNSSRLLEAVWPERAPATAGRILHVYVGQLRKALGSAQIETVGAGYALRFGGARLDLVEFERLAEEGRTLLEHGRADEAIEQLNTALRLWRGDALADLPVEYLAAERARLSELHLAAIELRNSGLLAAGRHGELVPQLTALAQRHPLREQLQGQLMLALYRSGRQAEALAIYRRLQTTLHREFGLEPTAELRRLEQEILRQDPRLAARRDLPAVTRTVVVAAHGSDLAPLLVLAQLAVSESSADVILIRLVETSSDVGVATRALEPLRSEQVRVTALRSDHGTRELLRLVADQDAYLLMLEIDDADLAAPAPITNSPCDVGFVLWRGQFDKALPIAVPFAGHDDDWAAVELAALIASAAKSSLRLLATAGPDDGGAGRFLATAALVVQRFLPVAVEPVVVERGQEASAALADCGLVIVGAGEWDPGRDDARRRFADRATRPVVFVRRGLKPGLIAPSHTLTRFRWSLS